VNLSFDLGALTPVPVGLLGTFVYDSYSTNGDALVDNVAAYALGIFYTARQDFDVGLDVRVSRSKFAQSDADIDIGAVAFTMRYFF
jgi:hypothetical protein